MAKEVNTILIDCVTIPQHARTISYKNFALLKWCLSPYSLPIYLYFLPKLRGHPSFANFIYSSSHHSFPLSRPQPPFTFLLQKCLLMRLWVKYYDLLRGRITLTYDFQLSMNRVGMLINGIFPHLPTGLSYQLLNLYPIIVFSFKFDKIHLSYDGRPCLLMALSTTLHLAQYIDYGDVTSFPPLDKSSQLIRRFYLLIY